MIFFSGVNDQMARDLEGMEYLNNRKNHYKSIEMLRSYPSMPSIDKEQREPWRGIRSQQHTPIKIKRTLTKMPAVQGNRKLNSVDIL